MSDAEFEKTMRGLEAGLTVRDIAVVDDLIVCSNLERVSDVLVRAAPLDIDNVPVRDDDGVITGVLENVKLLPREDFVEDRAKALTEKMLVSASQPLQTFLPDIASPSYRLVVDGGRISGVVTASDVIQLPVRLLVFALLTHLEQTMFAAIHRRCPHDWTAIAQLKAERQDEIHEAFERQQKNELNASPLELTLFSDKVDILFGLDVIDPSNGTRELFKKLCDLRNAIVHARGYADTAQELHEFLHHLGEIQRWTEQLGQPKRPS